MFNSSRSLVTLGLLVCLAGCAQSGPPANPSSPPSVSASPIATAASAERSASCAETRSFIASRTRQLLDAMNSAINAAGDGSQEGKAIEDVTTATKALAAGLAEQAAKTGDEELKAALTEFETSVRSMVAAMAAAGNDLDKIMGAIDLDAMNRFDGKVEAICG